MTLATTRLIPTILCGGAGSRLWPLSRRLHPKPLLRLGDGRSLLQQTFLRAAALPGVREILTVANRDLVFEIEDELREVNQAGVATSFVLEPFGRNTAPAVAAAALVSARAHGEDAVLLVLPADHVITDQAAFADAVARACQFATEGKLVTFGVRPEAPETGYGYIEADGSEVVRFVEKPSRERAREYLASGRFLWNSGMFTFTAGTVLRAMERYCGDILRATRACVERSACARERGTLRLMLDPEGFERVPGESIDYALMERASQVAVVPCDIGWTDVGSWTAFAGLVAPDENGNRIQGEVLTHDARNCYIWSRDRLVGAVGVENLVVVDTRDALLVAEASRVQDVRHLYARLEARGHEAHRLPPTVRRPWGSYTVLDEGEGFKIKRIEVRPGGSLSLQMHRQRSEHWVVVSGTARVVNGEREYVVEANQSTYIPAGCRHRLANPGPRALVVIEVQTGSYLGENDIVRFEDDYGRA